MVLSRSLKTIVYYVFVKCRWECRLRDELYFTCAGVISRKKTRKSQYQLESL